MLDWKSYFELNTMSAAALGYDQRDAGKSGSIWAANNVMAKHIIKTEGLGSNGNSLSAPLAEPSPERDNVEVIKSLNRELTKELKATQLKLQLLQTELEEAKGITFELLVQLRRAKD